jgi:hypothetical protein
MKPREIDDWAPLPAKESPRQWWRVLKSGLIGVVVSVLAIILLALIHGLLLGFHPAPIYGSYEPGLNAAASMAVLVVVFGGLPVAMVGFVVGVVVGLIRSAWKSSGG